MSSCTPGYTEVAAGLDGGLDCTSAPALVSTSAPWHLTNGTLPVVETLMVLGAVAALVHAVLRRRRRQDPVELGVWAGSVVYVLLLEPPLYFPQRFGLQDQLDLIFVHNRFSVQFLYDRLPLYILALYPALTWLAYVLVRSTGVLDRGRPWVGAACVALTFHCFYEIFDQLGPQLQWWGWNPAAPSNTPLLGSAPLSSAAIFAGASPFGFALLTHLLIARRAARGPVPWYSMLPRVIGVGALTPAFMVAFAIPYGIVGALDDDPSPVLQGAALWSVLGVMVLVAGPAFRTAFQDLPPTTAARSAPAAVIGGAIYLTVFAGLWIAALPDYLGAADGRTAAGTPVGHLGYVLLCAAACSAVILLALRSARDTGRSSPSLRLAPSHG